MMNVHKNTKQLNLIYDFFINDHDKLVINYVNDEVIELYQYIISHYSKINNIKLSIYDDQNLNDHDLFSLKKIWLIKTSSSKKIEEIIQSDEKIIILTDYKNFKKYKDRIISINGYQYENDFKLFVKNELKIDNESLIQFCKNYPYLLYSEVEKYKINKSYYIPDQSIHHESNNILEIRKKIYALSKSNTDLKTFYQYLKNEVEYKKFSFLTY